MDKIKLTTVTIQRTRQIGEYHYATETYAFPLRPETTIAEVERWLNRHTGALCWGGVTLCLDSPDEGEGGGDG